MMADVPAPPICLPVPLCLLRRERELLRFQTQVREDAATNSHIESLQAELKALDAWDLGFDNVKYHNDLQRAAFHHRQKRREEIVRELEQLADKRLTDAENE